jgi:hypothetical protein
MFINMIKTFFQVLRKYLQHKDKNKSNIVLFSSLINYLSQHNQFYF